MTSRSLAQSWYELLSSMRFAISLLTVLAIASVIGTVLKQNEPSANYLLQFGPYWFSVFQVLGLYDVYHAGWFLGILSFLVLSTGVCIYHQTPLMLREMKSFREQVQEASLRAFAHRAEFKTSSPAPELLPRLGNYLAAEGFRFKVSESGGDTLIAAKAGSRHRWGYFLTHAAIVVICLGGLVDGNLPLKAQQLLGYKKIETRSIPHTEVPAVSRLSPANLSFRGNVNVAEGSSADVVFLSVGDGYLLQELPFSIALKKFNIEHYPTGQPKNFASELVITDNTTKKNFEHTISVNHPLIYKGIAIYQASFDDGGSRLALNAWTLLGSNPKPHAVHGRVGETAGMHYGQANYTIELTGFRAFNVEALDDDGENPVAVPESLGERVLDVLGSGAPGDTRHTMQNVGPSFQYKVRDAQGQAREYSNYMQPLQLDGRWYLLSGMRATPNEPFRYLGFPVDGDGSLASYMQLRAALLDKRLHGEIARRVALQVLHGKTADAATQAQIAGSTVDVLGLFAAGGYEGVGRFIKEKVPGAESQKAARLYGKLLEQAALEAYRLTLERAGKPSVLQNEDTLQFVRDSLNTVSDTRFYGAPLYLQLVQYDEVLASGLQLTRSPGRNLVYLGSVLLVLGVFTMFYVRERRLWLLLKPYSGKTPGKVLFAMSAARPTLDFEREFAHHKAQIEKLMRGG